MRLSEYRRPWRRTFGMVATVGSVGCGPSVHIADGSASIRRDSADVTIVENVRPAWQQRPEWTVEPEAAFAISRVDGSEEAETFQRILNVVRLGDGSVVVLDGAEPFLRSFTAAGEPRWSSVRRGGGPEELTAPMLLTRIRGDSLIVDDGATPRALLLTSSGAVAGELPSRIGHAPDGGAGQRPLYPDVRLRDGALIASAVAMPSRREFEGTSTVAAYWPVYRVSRDGERIVELGRWPRGLLAQRSAPSVHVVFAARPTFAPTRDGFAYGFPSSDEVRLFRADGTPRLLVRTPGGRRLPTAAERATGARLLAQVAGHPDRRPLRPDQLLVDTLPAYGRLVVGTDEVIWRERFDPNAPPAGYGLARQDRGATWDAHDADGRWLGAVQMPTGFYLTDAGEDWVAGIHSDADDVQTPVVYRLHRR